MFGSFLIVKVLFIRPNILFVLFMAAMNCLDGSGVVWITNWRTPENAKTFQTVKGIMQNVSKNYAPCECFLKGDNIYAIEGPKEPLAT